jgi:hypothetical protein
MRCITCSLLLMQVCLLPIILYGCGNDDESPCVKGEVLCDDNYCANLMEDPTDCGSCGNSCNQWSICIEGSCACAEGHASCDGDWSNGCEVDSDTDANNCGTCGNMCATGQTCTDGVCQ